MSARDNDANGPDAAAEKKPRRSRKKGDAVTEHATGAQAAEATEAAGGLRVDRVGDVAMLWIDQPERSVALLTAEFLAQLAKTIDELDADSSVVAAVLANVKPGTFLAGADVSSFLEYKSEAEVEAAIHQGNALLARIEQWRKPLVAAVDGACMGGGTELVLAARYVIASSNPRTRFGLPEVQLGLLPGLGGSVRLPERVGMERALDMMLTGRNLFAKQARKAGLVHAVHHPDGMVEAAVHAARELAAGRLKARQPKRHLRATVIEKTPVRTLVFDQAGKQVTKRTHGNYPAPNAIIEVVREWARNGRKAGLDLSAKRFSELLFTPQARALIHLFFSQTASKKNPWESAALPVQAVGVLGAGLMGSGIAEVSAANGLQVFLKDRETDIALKGKYAVYSGVSSRVGKGRTAFERDRIVERVRAVGSYAPLAAAQVTIEAVLELPDLKRQMVAEIEAVTDGKHVFASNTSAIPIAEIASQAKRKEAVVGMHYFSPVPKMPLLEIVATDASADWALGTAYALGLKQGKTVIVVNDGPGFYTTRALGVYVGEALRALREGADALGLERAVVKYGFPLGPLAMTDDVGIDVGAKIQDVLADSLRARGLEPDPASANLAAAGYLGRKSGKGFYKYEGGKRKQEMDPEALRLAGFPATPGTAVESGHELAERLAFAIVREAVLCLEEGILRSPRDGDLGAVFGFGFPPFRGGPFFLVDHLGAAGFLARIKELEARHGARFSPPESLVRLAEEGGSYYPSSHHG